jgi:integrase
MAAGNRRQRGEGSIYKQGDLWRAVVDLGWEDGRRKRKYLSGKTQAEVVAKLRAALGQASVGQVTTGRAPTAEAWFKTWLDGMAQRVAPATVTTYTNVANFYVIPAVGRKRLDKVTAADFTAMTSGMVKKGLSTRTAQAAHKLLSQALKAAVRQGVIGHNPADKIDAPTPARKPLAALTAVEAKKLLAAAQDEPYGRLWTLALTTGMREGEIIALRWADVDLEVGVVHIRAGKTPKARRTIPLTKVAKAALGEAGDGDALVFTTLALTPKGRAGRPLERRNLLRKWHDFSIATLGRRTRFHDLRHTAATLMLGEAVPLKVISEMLGHSSIQVTSDVYTEVVDALKTDAAARLDGLFG